MNAPVSISSTTSTIAPGERRDAKILSRLATRLIKGIACVEERLVTNHDDLVDLLTDLKNHGCALGLTLGVWDLYHLGHAKYIDEGKRKLVEQFPDADHHIMVVGFDIDDLTRKRKGPTRPIVPEDERWRVLAHHRSVDILVPQYEQDQVFKLFRPDARIVSMSTTDLPEVDLMKQHCDQLINLPPQAETSSTARIRQLTIDGKFQVLEKVERGLAGLLETIRGSDD